MTLDPKPSGNTSGDASLVGWSATRRGRGYLGIIAALFWSMVIGVIFFHVIEFGFGPEMLYYLLPGIFSAGLMTHIWWRVMTAKGESKVGGAVVGLIAAITAYPLAIFIAMIMMILTREEIPRSVGDFFETWLAITLYAIVYTGAFSVAAGLIFGAIIAKNEPGVPR